LAAIPELADVPNVTGEPTHAWAEFRFAVVR
jgi:hypothetical protein